MSKTPIELETFYWKGQLRYKCPLKWGGVSCEYNTYDLDVLRRHMVETHVDPKLTTEVRSQPISSLVDEKGKPVVVKTPDDTPSDPEFKFVKFKSES